MGRSPVQHQPQAMEMEPMERERIAMEHRIPAPEVWEQTTQTATDRWGQRGPAPQMGEQRAPADRPETERDLQARLQEADLAAADTKIFRH
jgi:hypothetical protein